MTTVYLGELLLGFSIAAWVGLKFICQPFARLKSGCVTGYAKLGRFLARLLLASLFLPLSLGSCNRISSQPYNGYAQPPPNTTAAHPPRAGKPLASDGVEALALYDSRRPDSFADNLCLLASYYGLGCQKIDHADTQLSEPAMRDPSGRPFRLIGLSGDVLEQAQSPDDSTGSGALSASELEALRKAVSGGASLLVSNLSSRQSTASLSSLTNAALSLGDPLPGQRTGWAVGPDDPQVTAQFTGQVISATHSSPQAGYAIRVNKPEQVSILLSSQDQDGQDYPVFVKVHAGSGAIYVDTAAPLADLEQTPLRQQYYNPQKFASLFPLMAALREAFGEQAWHNPHSYANLQIDDPSLTNPYKQLHYPELLKEMEAHNFHTTIAMPAVAWDKTDPKVVDLVRAHPERFSVVPHGNNHDGYEFFKYTLAPDDPEKDANHYARPLADQAADIQQGLQRMQSFSQRSGLPWERVMIFPWAISPEPTLQLLKQANFLGTVNLQDAPLGATRPSAWDYGMYPAIMDYANFAVVTRRPPGAYRPFRPDLQPFLFDLFANKPALIYTHAWQGELFDGGMGAFDPLADQLNRVSGGVEWRSLGYILTHLWLQKLEADDSESVQFYTNQLDFTNESGKENDFHFAKAETLNVPIRQVTVDGYPFPYRVEAGELRLDLLLAAGEQAVIRIDYGD